MAKVTVVISKYRFNKPPVFSEEEFVSYKQIFSIDPNYNMSPQKSFWNEFEHIKWGLILFAGGILGGLIWDPLAIIAGLAFFFLIMSLITGTAQSMSNYQRFLNEKNSYYKNLQQIIMTSTSYQEFKIKSIRL